MPAGAMGRAIRRARETLLAGDGGPSDEQLLERFLSQRDGAAFEAIVRRHGPLVLGVCRRVTRHEQDAEDAFQAAWLVLALRAGTIRARESLPGWLYGVACRTALRARSVGSRRRARETPMGEVPHPVVEPAAAGDELSRVFDEELSRLSEKCRLPVVLCELQGRSRKEVARQLQIPEGTLSSRLAAARRILATRLRRRGLALSGAVLAVARVPPSLATAGARVATLCAADKRALAGTVPVQVVELTEGVMRVSYLTKLKVLVAVVCVLAVAGLAGGVLSARAPVPRSESKPEARPADAAPGSGGPELAEKWQDLLGRIDPEQHTVGRGIWRQKGGKLTGYPADHGARLRVPVVPKGNYELRARWQPRDGDSSVHFIVPHGDRMASVEVLTRRNCAGLGDLNGVRPDINETKTEVKIKPGKVYDVFIKVSVNGAQVHVLGKLDDATIVDWEGKRSELEHEFFAPAKPASLGLAVSGQMSVFHSLELRMLSGTAAPLAFGFAGGYADLTSEPSGLRDTATAGGTRLTSPSCTARA